MSEWRLDVADLKPDALLDRKQAAAALTAQGYPIACATLATKATRGGGPPFRKFGSRPLYKWSDALAWAEGRTSGPVTSARAARDFQHKA